MKTNLKHISRRTISLILCVLMLFSTLMVGSITANAGTDTTVYICPSQITSFNSYVNSSTGELNSGYELKLNTNHAGQGPDEWHPYTMTKCEGTIGGKAVYSFSFTDTYGGLACIQFQIYEGSAQKAIIQPFGTKEWKNPSLYNNKLYDGGNWVDPSWDSSGGDTKTDYYFAGVDNVWTHTKLTKSQDGTYAYYPNKISTEFKITKGNWNGSIGAGCDCVVKTASNNEAADINLNGTNNNITPASSGYVVVLYNDNPYYNYTGNSYDVQVICVSSLDRLNTSTTQHTVTYGDNITCSVTSGSQVDEGTEVTFTATAETGYEFQGWYSDPSCTTPISGTSGTTYTTSVNSDTNVYAKFNEIIRTVNISGGTSTSTTAGITTKGTATVDIPSGKIFKNWTIPEGITLTDGTTATSETIKFTATSDNLTVTANFVDVYSVTVNGVNNPTSTPTDLSKVEAGTAVTITLPSSTGVHFSVSATGVSHSFENNIISFTMPASNVTITVSATYDIKVTNPTNGTASVSKTPAAANEEITVTANPADGYELNAITVTDGVTVTNNKFTMPAKPVTVTVTFKETLHKVTITNDVNSTTSTKQVGKITPVDISAGEITGYTFKNWTATTGITIADSSSASTTITASAAGTVTANYDEDLSTNWVIHGDFGDGWKSTALTKYAGTGTLAHVDIDLPANSTYNFGFKTGEDWYRYNTADITADNCTNLQLSKKTGENQNCTINTEYEGTYVFQFDTSTKKLTVVYPIPGETTKYDLTINAPTPIDSYVTNYSVTYTKDRAETTETVAKGGKIQVDEGSTVTITANEIVSAVDSSDIVSVESWFVNGSEDKTQNTKVLTLSNVTQNTTVYPKVYGKISVSSITVANTDDVNVNPTATVVMGKSADQAGGSTKYKPVVKVKDSLGNVTTFYGAVVEASGQQYTFAPIEITGLSKGSYTVTAEIIGYNDSDTQVAYGVSAEKAMDYGCSYKETAYTGDVAWVDAVPSYNGGDKATLIKWNNHTGSNHNTDGKPYVFYLPNSVDMSHVTIYHNFSSLTIGSQAITSGNSYSFDTNTEYSFTSNKSSGNVKFMKGSQNSTQLYLNTTNADGTAAYNLPTSTGGNYSTKGSVECVGNSIAVDQTGTVNSYKVKKLKGRGNSSWEASYKLFGKYAYNITLKDSVSLFGLAGSNKNCNTKYSMLANNVDEAQVRNSYIYKLAKELGYEYFPNFQMTDVYDNGVYMGSYLICQKVELGKKGMITEPEIKYDDPVDEAGQTVDFTLQEGTCDGSKYQYSSNRVDSTNYNSGGTYLMEFELDDRYTAEASWFISKKGQPIVVASPENASKNEMEFIIPKWNTVEAAVYDGNIDSVRDKIDVESFAKMYLIQELSKNLDACSTSYNILYKSAEDKFYAEPVWDYDWTLGQYAKDPKKIVGTHEDVDNNHSHSYGFFARYKGMIGKSTKTYDFEAQLCQNTSFWSDVQTIWKNEFYTVATNGNEYLKNTYIPGIKDTILMNENRWGFIANNLSWEWGTNDTGSDFDAVTNATTTWITDRLTWLNGKIPTTMYTVKAGDGATMTYMDNMGNGKLNAYTQFASGTRLTFTAANQPGKQFMGWSTNGTDVVDSLGKNLTMTVSVSGDATYTPIFRMTYEVKTTPVKYYVDMHGDSNLEPTINFADGDKLALTKVGSSTVYSGTYNTKYYVDGEKLVDIATKISTITAGGKNLALTSANALTKKCLETGEVWIEATQSIANAQATNNTTVAKGATTTKGTKKRVYWNNKYAVFATPRIYYWDSSNKSTNGISWDNSPNMKQIQEGEGNYYYDIPSEMDRIIVFGKYNGNDKQTVDIEVNSSAYAFAPGDNLDNDQQGGKFKVWSWDPMPADPNPISYASSYELYDDDKTGTHSIAPTLNPNATATYSVADSSIATVSDTGVITPNAIGTTKVTINITGTSNDTATVETTIKVIDRPVIATPAYAIMSYQSNTSSFQAVGGTLGTLEITLAGSAYSGVTTGGIIDGNTVKYAVADPTVTAYADLAVTVTAPSTGNENYKFVDWTKNGSAISGATNDLTVTLNTVSTDKYIVTYQLDSVQVVFTYNFVDYDTSGGYEYVAGGPTKAASYKTAPKSVHASAIVKSQDGNGYVVTDTLKTAAETNMPNIISNYFSYSLDTDSVSAPTMIDGIYYVTATMTNTARTYAVSVNGKKVGDFTFQKEVVLSATKYTATSDTGYVWKIDGQDTPISDKEVYSLKVGGDIKLTVDASNGTEKIKNLSAINATFYEIKTNNNKNYVGQNFYIQNFYRQDDPVYNENGEVVDGATDKTFEGAGVLSYNATYDSTTETYKPVSATVRNFDYTNKTALLGVAESIGVEATDNSASNSIHEASGLNYSFVKGSDTRDDITGQEFMKYSQTQGCYSYFYQAVTEQSKLYRSQYYVVYSYYVYSYMLNGVKTYVYVMSDQYATAKVYAS